MISFPAGQAASAASPIVDPFIPYNSVRLYEDAIAIAGRYPDVVSAETIGQSVLGKDILLLKLGKGTRPLLWIGALHAREAVTAAYLLLIAEEYAGAYDSHSAYGGMPAEKVQWLLEEFTVYLVPMANPDGVDIVTAGGLANVHIRNPGTWKSNANGVNLNRNFPFDWNGYTTGTDHRNNNYLSYKGASAGSEPETRALMALCESAAFEHMVSCHCQGKVIYYRDNKNGNISGDETLAKTLAKTTGYTLMPSTTSAAAGWAGGFENWFRYQYKKPGICLEFCRYNTADKATMAKFYTPDMVNWHKSRHLLFDVMNAYSNLTAYPTASTIYVNGESVSFDAYLIGGNNYFKLRDVACALSGTEKQFDARWDGTTDAILLTAGVPYTPVGGEMAGKGPDIQKPIPTKSAIWLDGQRVNVKACLILGNNYIKLRDTAQLFDFHVSWHDGEDSVSIDTGLPYEE